MKRTFAYLLAGLTLMTALAGCKQTAGQGVPADTPAPAASEPDSSGKEESAVSNDSAGGIVVGFSNWSRSFEFYVDMEKGLQKAADELGVELILQDANGDLPTQQKQLENYVSRNVNGIILVPIDSEACAAEIEMVNEKNIPVVTVDIEATGGGKVESHIASDNVYGGQLAAQFIGEYLGGKGKVAVLDNPSITPLIERRDGFVNEMKEKYPEIEVVSVQSGESTREKGMEITENWLQKYDDLGAIFGTNDMMALGALQAVAAKGKDDIAIVGFDATAEACQAISEGSAMKASIAQQPVELGYTAMQALQKALNNEAAEAKIEVPVITVSAENVADYM